MMSDIKKAYMEMYKILEANKDEKISTVLPELVELMTSKVQISCHRADEDGNVTEIFCYYHKEWELVSECEYGKKTASKTGLNTMCKEGINHWTKQQKIKKEIPSLIMEMLQAGELEIGDMQAKQLEMEAECMVIVPRS